MDNTLQKLRELTEKLPAPLLTGLIADSCPHVEYVIDGTCIGFALYWEQDVAVQRAFMSGGSHFTLHEHKVHEFLLVYQGYITVTIDDEEHEVEPPDAIHIPPNTPHTVLAHEDTWMIGITVPASEGYPRVERKNN
jgi:mannose-6-phosphate isomerase-like protein (cupin superfamily)